MDVDLKEKGYKGQQQSKESHRHCVIGRLCGQGNMTKDAGNARMKRWQPTKSMCSRKVSFIELGKSF